MPVNVSLQSLSERLSAELAASFDPRATGPMLGGDGVLKGFERFGARVSAADVTLSDAFTVALGALNSIYDRFGKSVATSDREHAAGIALTVVAEAYRGAVPHFLVAEDDTFPDTQHERLAALHRINRAATSNMHSDEMLDIVADAVKNATKADASAIFLYHEGTGLLTLDATNGLNQEAVGKVTLHPGEGIVGRAAVEGVLISATNARDHESYLPHPGIGDDQYASQVSVPMIQAQNRLVGILNIHSIEPRTWDHEELEFLRTVAGELAIAIDNARVYAQTDEQLHQKVEELSTLQRVTRSLTSTLELKDVLRLITQNGIAIANAEAAAVFRPNKLANSTEPIIESRIGSVRMLLDVRQRNDVIERVLRTGAAASAHLQYEDGPAQIFCMPLRTAREVVGAIAYRLEAGLEIPAERIGLLQAFADSAAIAIENANLYSDAVHSLRTQRTLVQEMHHRVRNNLQTVAALLSLQIRAAENAPWAVEIREAVSRIQAIAGVHDLLSDPSRFTGATVDKIARLVAEDAHSTLIPPTLKVTFDIPPSDLRIPSNQATIMSLLINELAANAISHGFEDRTEGFIRIRAWEDNGYANVEIFNDGEKVPEGFEPSQSQGLGMKITHRLVTSDLRGTFTITSDAEGTYATIRFPIAAEKDQTV
ncbi:MAG: GAF domain-containing protein [Thermomicrobiales bacterium]|nr:GAF domain-containing protein [Thermomicrobiales bacterium]